MTDAPYYFWIDLESTGLDEHADPILEIGFVVTQSVYPYEDVRRGSFVVLPAGDAWSHRFNPYVLRMHTTNGLLADVFEHGLPIADVETEIIDILGLIGGKHDFVIAGSGVGHYDKKVIDAQLPRLAKWFRYYTADVGTMRRLLQSMPHLEPLVTEGRKAGAVAEGEKAHRGLADILSHLDELRFYGSNIQMHSRLQPGI